MKYNLIKRQIGTALLAFLPLLGSAQLVKHDRLLSFEEAEVPAFITTDNSKLSLSNTHYKDGKNSLKWTFTNGGEIRIAKDLHFEQKDPTGKDTYLSTFVIWIYNNTPLDTTVEFQFLKDGKKCTSFPFKINYKGWRAAWVCYERDMQGIPEEGMNEIRIIAPQNTSGELFFDQLVTAAKADSRHQTADIQVPFVNKHATNHWLVLLKNSEIKPDIPLEENLSNQQIEDIKTIEKRLYDNIYTPSEFTETSLQSIEKDYNSYQIKYIDNKVSGLPIFFGRASEIFERLSIPKWKTLYTDNHMEFQKYFNLMNRIAIAFHNATEEADRKKLENYFLAMYDHAHDQGAAYGSGLGNITHYGYSFRNIYTAYFLMKDVFAKTGRLDDAVKTLQWYAMTNEIHIKREKNGIDMDAFNTTANGRLCSIMIMEDSPEKVRYLKAFSRWIDKGSLPATGLDGAFKIDGAAFHHCNNYPAYAVGGLSGATDMIYFLSRTSFAVSQEAHQTVKRVLETMRFYCNQKNFPLSMSGRHPDGKGQLIPIHFGTMALAGTPDGEKEIDSEMGAAYLRLIASAEDGDKPEYMPSSNNKTELKIAKILTDKGIKPEADPQGNLALGYGAISVQRRDNWSAVVRGHSRYLWAAEHYIGANLYGRYLAHGSMQIMTAKDGETVTPESSGWVQDGFDWGRIPGTTAIHLPVEQLKANVLNVDTISGFEEMLFSDEAFAGGISQNGTNGAFGMKLHEHDKYNGSHRARKSYHFFDGRIICLGSDIENINKDYNTETTIFQLAVTDQQGADYWNNYNPKNNFYIDHLGTGYYIPKKKENKLNFEKNFPQHSRRQNTGEETSGNWVALTIDHGKAPKGQSYEYMVLPKTNLKTMEQVVKKEPYKVLQKDKNAHIVKDLQSNTTSYVLFETPTKLPKGLVLGADTACLIMVKEDKNNILLTVCNPDLALYSGPADEIFDENGKRVERSIYSRPWKFNESQEMPITVTLAGEWNIKENDKCQVIKSDNKKTILRFACKDGMSINIELDR